nr:S8 family serine peptidase [Anaerolineaceae bacterium]HPN54160.1 S8 family serine peptidase [Anaerolineaceae bacterium]
MFHKWLNIIIVFVLTLNLLGFAANPVPALPATQPVEVVSGEKSAPEETTGVIIKLRPEARLEAGSLQTHVASLDRTLADMGALAFRPVHGSARTYRLELPLGTDIEEAARMLDRDPAVEYAEPDYQARLISAPDDPRYGEQWGLAKIQVEDAWAQSMGSPAVVIAVIDSGLDTTHPDLAANLWVNPGEIAGNGLDDDSNGFVDDIHGWNFVDSSNDVTDAIGHGSLVAGIAAARTGNATGIAGVCGLCQIMPVKVSQVSGIANYSDIAAGINYATSKGADVINLSVGGYADSQAVKDAVNNALSKGVVVVGGAGNDNKATPFYPAAYDGVIAVAGTASDDVKVSTSNYGSWVDVSAPGENILSTTLGDYSSGSGTSYAAPFVAGMAGLLKTLHPDWTPAMIRSQFMHTADSVEGVNPGLAGLLGAGRLNAANAMQAPQPMLKYQSYTGNGVASYRPNFGTAVALNVSVLNDWSDAAGVNGVLSSTDPYVTITTGTASFGDLLAGQTGSNPTALGFTIASGAGYNHAMPFTLALSANGGSYTTTLNFTITTRSSEEPFSGTISTNTTWTSDKLYKITGNVGVAPGAVLTIQPGTVVQFAGNYALNIGGGLVARGTEEQPIHFEPYTAGGSWNRILFDDSSQDAQTTAEGVYLSGNVLEYVMMDGSVSGIGCTNATPYLGYVNTSGGGLTCSLGTTTLWLTDSTVAGEFIVTQSGSEPIHLLRVNSDSVNTSLPPAIIFESKFSGNVSINGNGEINTTIFGYLSVKDGKIRNVTTLNGGIDIQTGYVVGSDLYGGGINIGNTSLVSDNTIIGGGINAGAGSIVEENRVSWGGITVGSGSQIQNNEVMYGGINDGGNSSINYNSIEYSHGIGILTSGTSTVEYNRVVSSEKQGIVNRYGIIENNLIASSADNGVEIISASVCHNTFVYNKGTGIYIAGIPASFQGNNFEFNVGVYDVYLSTPVTAISELPAQNNWWGTTDVSIINNRINDYYDDYNLAKLIISPMLTSPSQTAPTYVRNVTLDPTSPVGVESVNFTVLFSREMGNSESPKLFFRNTPADYWIRKSGIPSYKSYIVLSVVNGKIYAIGGATSSNLEEYDPITDTWVKKADMLTPRYSFNAVTATNGKIYAIGGYKMGGYDGFNIVEEYDPLTDTWTKKSDKPTGGYGIALVSGENGLIYALGFEQAQKSFEVYDTTTDSWTRKTDLPEWFGRFSAKPQNVVYLNNKILVFWEKFYGEYDINRDLWIRRTTIGDVGLRDELGAVLVVDNGEIFNFGGKSVFKFNQANNSWVKVNEIPFTLASYDYATTAVGNGKIFLIGLDIEEIAMVVGQYTVPSLQHPIEINSMWIDSTKYGASYDFSSLIPKGEYEILVTGVSDKDGIKTAPDSRNTFQVDYAGEISVNTPPPIPVVLAWGNGTLNIVDKKNWTQKKAKTRCKM